MTKKEEREEARRLRREGMSINKIAKKLGIALSSASTWCRDIPLTEDQEEALRFSNERREAQTKGAKANVDMLIFTVRNGACIKRRGDRKPVKRMRCI